MLCQLYLNLKKNEAKTQDRREITKGTVHTLKSLGYRESQAFTEGVWQEQIYML